MKTRKIVAVTMAGLMAAGLAGCGGSSSSTTTAAASSAAETSAAAESGAAESGASEASQAASGEAKYTIKLCTEQTADDPITQGNQKWADLVSEKTNGAVKIEVYPNSELGKKADLIEMGMMGQNVCTIADGSYLMDYVPDFGVVMGPFLFTDWDAMYKITGSDWWAEQAKALEDQGLEIISTNWIYGERQLMTKKEIKSDDLKGLKIRVPNNDISVQMFNLLGAASTPMALSDVYTSLSQGVVDGVENPLTTLYNNKFQEVCKYITMTNHQMTFSNFVVGKKFWDTIPEEYQQAIVEAGEEAAEYNNDLYKEQSQKMVDTFKSEGTTVNELDAQTQEDFKNACLKLYQDYEDNGTWTKGLYDQIQSIINS